MARLLRGAAGAILALALLAFVVAFSRWPWAAEARAEAEARLAWRLRTEQVTLCRRRSAEELARMPVHMRREMDCARRLVPYHLTVHLDGALALEDTLRPRGAQADRPLGVYARLRLAPGAHRLAIRFAPLSDSAQAVPLELDTVLAFAPRQVLVIGADERTRRFLVRDSVAAN